MVDAVEPDQVQDAVAFGRESANAIDEALAKYSVELPALDMRLVLDTAFAALARIAAETKRESGVAPSDAEPAYAKSFRLWTFAPVDVSIIASSPCLMAKAVHLASGCSSGAMQGSTPSAWTARRFKRVASRSIARRSLTKPLRLLSVARNGFCLGC